MSDGTVVCWWIIAEEKRNLHFPDYSWPIRNVSLFRSTGRTMIWTVTTIFALFQPTAESCPGRSSRSDSKITSVCFQDLLAKLSKLFSLVSSLLWRFRVGCLINPILSYSTIMFLFHFPRTSSYLQIFSNWPSVLLRLKIKMVDSKSAWTVRLHVRYENQSSSCLSSMFVMWVVLLCVVSGTSFDFHKQTEHLFLVGTEDGKIHKVC